MITWVSKSKQRLLRNRCGEAVRRDILLCSVAVRWTQFEAPEPVGRITQSPLMRTSAVIMEEEMGTRKAEVNSLFKVARMLPQYFRMAVCVDTFKTSSVDGAPGWHSH